MNCNIGKPFASQTSIQVLKELVKTLVQTFEISNYLKETETDCSHVELKTMFCASFFTMQAYNYLKM